MRWRAAAVALLVLAAASASMPTQAQMPLADPSAWVHLGPVKMKPRGFPPAFTGSAQNPTLWIAEGEIWKLPPSATSWTVLANFAASGRMYFDLFGSPSDTLFSAPWGGLWRSTDAGASFSELRSPVTGSTGGRFGPEGALGRVPAEAPFAGRLVVYDGIYDGATATFGPEFLYSDDAGDTWTRAEASPRMQAFQIHAFRSGRILAAGFYGAALSDDGARTFRAVPQLYKTAFIGFDLTHMAMLNGFTTGRPGDSAEGRLLLVGSQARRPSTYVWASDDEGTTWREVHAFTNDGAGGIDAVPASVGGGPGWAVATGGSGAVHATTDGGETWTRIGQVPETGPLSGLPTFTASTAVGPDGRLYVCVAGRGNLPYWSWITKGRIADAIRVAVASEETASEPPPSRLRVTVRPNPAGGRAEAVVTMAEAGPVRVIVLDALGREVAVVLDGASAAGERVVGFDTSSWPPGVYVVRVVAGSRVATARLVVAR